jgi:hypothetical protein
LLVCTMIRNFRSWLAGFNLLSLEDISYAHAA